ncbi:MAG: class I SAM-dependent methyltransferase [Planctomycetota bacterium]
MRHPEPSRTVASKGLHVHLASATDLPFDDEQFELVMSTDCIEHLRPDDVVTAVDEAWRVSSKYFAFKINPRTDRNRMRKFLARTPLHLTLMPLEAWTALFERKGGKLIQVPGVDNEEFVIEKP